MHREALNLILSRTCHLSYNEETKVATFLIKGIRIVAQELPCTQEENFPYEILSFE